MIAENIFLLILCGITIICGIIGMVTARNRHDFTNALLLCLVGFTPGVMLLFFLAVLLVVILVYEKLMNLIFKDKN